MTEKQIKQLRRGHTTVDDWKLTMLLDDLDAKDICSAYDIFNIQMKCKYLSVALGIALDDMPSHTWFQCCNEEVRRVNQAGGRTQAYQNKRDTICYFCAKRI
jgi:hypothetical protein